MARYNAGGTKVAGRTEQQVAVRLARHEWAWVTAMLDDTLEALKQKVQREAHAEAYHELHLQEKRLNTILARICRQLDLRTTEEGIP